MYPPKPSVGFDKERQSAWIETEGQKIEIKVVLNRAAKSYRVVWKQGQLRLTLPTGARIRDVQKWLEAAAPKIVEYHSRCLEQENKAAASPISYLGSPLALQPVGGSGSYSAELVGATLRVGGTTDLTIAETVAAVWMIQQAKKIILERCEARASEMNLTYDSVTVKEISSRWGSCSTKKNLNFSWRCVMAPMEVLDYLVVHELSHLVHMNHSPAFWKLVEDHCSDFKRLDRWLTKNGRPLMTRIPPMSVARCLRMDLEPALPIPLPTNRDELSEAATKDGLEGEGTPRASQPISISQLNLFAEGE